MKDGPDEEGPVVDIRDVSYNEVADLFVIVVGTDKIGVCAVQLEDGPDTELVLNGEGKVDAWPLPMWERQPYVDALARITSYWRAKDSKSIIPADKRAKGINHYARGAWLMYERAPKVNDDGIDLLWNIARDPSGMEHEGRSLKTREGNLRFVGEIMSRYAQSLAVFAS